MQQGRVLKAYNSFFYVSSPEGLVTCQLRGKFKKRQSIFPGDCVAYTDLSDGTGVIEQLFPRKSLMRRPAVANIDQAVLTFAAAQPDLHPLLLNRFLVLAEWSMIPSIILCVNKCDLLGVEGRAVLSEYESLGYPLVRVSAREKTGIAELAGHLAHHVTVFAGPSGVGKSSLLNAIDPTLTLTTGHVSKKIKRGRHTTRVAELLPYQEGYIVDTPGFSAMELEQIDETRLTDYFPEMRPYHGQCRFSPCSHSHEPGCKIKEAVQEGAILPERYTAYLAILQEIRERKKDYV